MPVTHRGSNVTWRDANVIHRPSSRTFYMPYPIMLGIDMEIVSAEMSILGTVDERTNKNDRDPGDGMIRLAQKVRQNAHCFPYVIPKDRDGDALSVDAIESVTWSIFDSDDVVVGTEDNAITAPDDQGRWVANVTPTYTDLTGTRAERKVIVFTVTFSGTIGGVNYTDLTAKIQGKFTVTPVTGE